MAILFSSLLALLGGFLRAGKGVLVSMSLVLGGTTSFDGWFRAIICFDI